MSFGALHRAFSKKCVRQILEGKEVQAKQDLCEFIDYIRSKRPLFEQFFVYENIHNHTETDRDLAILFIRETLDTLENLDRGDVLTMNNLLRYKFKLNEDHTPIDDAIAILVESKVSDFKYDTSRVAKAFKVVLEHVMAAKPKKQSYAKLIRKQNQFGSELEYFTPQDVVRIGVNSFNSEFGPIFSEAERKLFSKIRNASTPESLSTLYTEEYVLMVNEAKTFVNDDLDDDITRNIELAIKRLKNKPSLDNLLNVVELRTQMQLLRSAE